MKIKIAARFDDEPTGPGYTFSLPDDMDGWALETAIVAIVSEALPDVAKAVRDRAQERRKQAAA